MTAVGVPRSATNPPPTLPLRARDTSGQIAPLAPKFKLTAALWENEGCMIFEVRVDDEIVARRDDNHMINGTKLLNVVGLKRGARDTMLKSEKTRHVIKTGPKHIRGVW